jgi:hypothetical protein
MSVSTTPTAALCHRGAIRRSLLTAKTATFVISLTFRAIKTYFMAGPE